MFVIELNVHTGGKTYMNKQSDTYIIYQFLSLV